MSPESRVPSPQFQSIEARPQTLAQRVNNTTFCPPEVRLKHLLKVHGEAAVISAAVCSGPPMTRLWEMDSTMQPIRSKCIRAT